MIYPATSKGCQEATDMSTKRDILSITGLTPDETMKIVHRAKLIKSEEPSTPLSNKNVALFFDKPSLRTRTSF